MRVGILGIGAIGGLLAALLHRNGHNPICICRKKTNDFISRSGLKLESKIFGNYHFSPRSTSFLKRRSRFVVYYHQDTIFANGIEAGESFMRFVIQ